MPKRIYISADYSEENGDRDVVEILNKWGSDNQRIVNFVDMAQVISGSVSKNPDCRPCDLKKEFNDQINASSYVIFVIGDKTKYREAGKSCSRMSSSNCDCTPYKGNSKGKKDCKVYAIYPPGKNLGNINSYSYLQHEFEQAKKQDKNIIILYNSLKNQPEWIPSYMENYKGAAIPFWTKNILDQKIGNYYLIKEALGYV